MEQVVILGAGLAGLAVSHHLGHERCLLLEQASHPFGHIASQVRDGFTWDEGPHVSFTRHAYVRELFAQSVGGEFIESPACVGNYYHGHWIDHPAQVSLHQVPEPLRSRCLESFLQSRPAASAAATPPANYQEWIERAFGPVFAENFAAVYTRKYWTRSPRELTTEWVGGRVHSPSLEDVVAGTKAPLGRNAHYVTTFRYPRRGGYQSFAEILRSGARIRLGTGVSSIDLAGCQVQLTDGSTLNYQRLVNTIPLPEFIRIARNVPARVREAALALNCSQLLLVNIAARHATRRPETWCYVYDEDKLATRINFTEHLSPGNAPEKHTGVQTEVYASRHRPFPGSPNEIAQQVQNELAAMDLIDSASVTSTHTHPVSWANVIFDHDTKPALAIIWAWLEEFGLCREADDLHPLTDWSRAESEPSPEQSSPRLLFAGRFGQWKYFWTDDCVLRGRKLGNLFPSTRPGQPG
jgi:protoporphyrinogen oxidase